jgi:serine/threonine protein kinase
LLKEGGRQWFESFGTNALAVPPHPNVLNCTRIDRDGDIPFVIMEHVRGRWWDSAIASGGLIDITHMLDVAIQVARGLDWLHSHGVVHYNVKPANVLISDPGIARVWKYGEFGVKTRAYASPEQLAGATELSFATDTWSWAVSLLHMFVGRVTWPSGAKAPDALQRYMRAGPLREELPLMPGPLADLLCQCLQTSPAARPEAMADVAATVEKVYQGITGEQYSPPMELPPTEKAGEEGAKGPAAEAGPAQAPEPQPEAAPPDEPQAADEASEPPGRKPAGRRAFYKSQRARARPGGRRASSE